MFQCKSVDEGVELWTERHTEAAEAVERAWEGMGAMAEAAEAAGSDGEEPGVVEALLETELVF